MKKQPQVTEATRKNLLTAFWSLSERKSIGQIGIKEITDRAGYHRATFYQYFTDIFDLLKQEEDKLVRCIEELVSQLAPRQGLDGMLEKVADFYLQNGSKLSLLLGSKGDPEFLAKFKTALYPIFTSARDLRDDEKAHVIFEFGINGLLMAFNSWYGNNRNLSLGDFIKLVREIIQTGIIRTLEATRAEN